MKSIAYFRQILFRLASSRNFIITLVLAVGLSPIYLFPEYFIPLDDVSDQLYPFIFETKRMLSTGSPWWTWSSFLGDNFIGSYAYYTFTRPLLLAVCLLPYKYIGAGLVASIYINFLILGWLVSCYLRIMGFDPKLRLIGSLLFTLSSYMICQLIYCMFLEPIQAFVILLICIERFLQDRRFSLSALTLASFAIALVNYYFIPASLIAAFIYFLCRTLFCYRERWPSLTLKAAGCVCLGVFMASILLVPVMMYLSGSTRIEIHNYTDFHYGNNWALRVFSLVAPIPNDGKLFLHIIDSGWYLNTAYVGIFGLLLFIFYAIRHRHNWVTILCTVYIVCLVTPLNGIFSLFTHSYFTRWCYALIMALLIATLSYLKEHRGRKIPLRPTLIYCAITFYLFTAVYCYAVFIRLYPAKTFRFDVLWATYICAAALFLFNTATLMLLSRYPVLSRQWSLICITSVVVISILHSMFVSYRYATNPVRKNSVHETFVRLINSRIDCDTFSSRTYFDRDPIDKNLNSNHHLICNRPAIPTYISTLNPVTNNLAYIINHNNYWYITIDLYQESAITLLSVKDFDTFGDYPFTTVPQAALCGDRYIPMGMAYDRYSLMEDSLADVERAKSHDILRGMLASVLIDKGDEPELSRYMSPVEFRDSLPFDSLVAARRAYTCDSFAGDTHGFTATISLPDTMVVMFSTAADPGFTATIDGKPSKIYNVNMGMSASIVPAGRHTIRYEYFPPGLRTGAILSLAGLLIFLSLVLFEICSSRYPNR